MLVRRRERTIREEAAEHLELLICLVCLGCWNKDWHKHSVAGHQASLVPHNKSLMEVSRHWRLEIGGLTCKEDIVHILLFLLGKGHDDSGVA